MLLLAHGLLHSLRHSFVYSVCLPHPGTVPGKKEDTDLALRWDECEELGYRAIREEERFRKATGV